MTGGSAVLWSGGLDSTVLLADELSTQPRVVAIHVRCGLAWEDAEARAMERLLTHAPFAGRVACVAGLAIPAVEHYPADHWAVRGAPPAYDSPDEDVYLEGRNRMLTMTAATWCGQHGVNRLAIGSLAGNPFPDATPEFFASMTREVSQTLNRPMAIVAPFLTQTKREVIVLGRRLGVPLDLTLSCMNPGPGDRHCLSCSKCRERLNAFAEF